MQINVPTADIEEIYRIPASSTSHRFSPPHPSCQLWLLIGRVLYLIRAHDRGVYSRWKSSRARLLCLCVPIFTVMAWPALNSDDNHSGRDWSVNSTELCSHDRLDGWLAGWAL